MVDDPIADPDIAARDVLQPRNHAQRRRLAAAGRADQGHELLVGNLEIDVLHGMEQRAIMLVELAECDRCHFPAVTELDAIRNPPAATCAAGFTASTIERPCF